jgi:hypothetical protein
LPLRRGVFARAHQFRAEVLGGNTALLHELEVKALGAEFCAECILRFMTSERTSSQHAAKLGNEILRSFYTHRQAHERVADP